MWQGYDKRVPNINGKIASNLNLERRFFLTRQTCVVIYCSVFWKVHAFWFGNFTSLIENNLSKIRIIVSECITYRETFIGCMIIV